MEAPSLRKAQAALDAMGFRCPRSGRLGAATRSALLDFQGNMRLPATGKLDAATWEAIWRLRHLWQPKE